jgi:hypothetical protein
VSSKALSETDQASAASLLSSAAETLAFEWLCVALLLASVVFSLVVAIGASVASLLVCAASPILLPCRPTHFAGTGQVTPVVAHQSHWPESSYCAPAAGPLHSQIPPHTFLPHSKRQVSRATCYLSLGSATRIQRVRVVASYSKKPTRRDKSKFLVSKFDPGCSVQGSGL